MAEHVPYNPSPDVNPSGPSGNDYQRIQSSPEDFGGVIARATEKTGEQTVGAGVKGLDAATARQEFYNKVAGDDAYNQYSAALTKLLRGDPSDPNDGGYLGTHGSDAMSKRKPLTQQIDDLRNQIRNNMHTDMARLYFDQDSRRLQQFSLEKVGAHADQQMQSWALATNKASSERSIRSITDDPSDKNFDAEVKRLTDAELKTEQLNSGQDLTPDQRAAATARGYNAAVHAAVLAKSIDDPIAANAFLQAHKQGLKPETIDALESHLRPKIADTMAQKIVHGGGAGGDYYDRLAQVESRGDPKAVSPTGYKGLFQFGPREWEKYGHGASIFDPAAQRRAAREMTEDNRAIMKDGLGREPTDSEMYLAWNMGAGGALNLLRNPDLPAGHMVSSKAIIANRGDPNQSAGSWAHKVMARYEATGGAGGGSGPPKDEAEALQQGEAWVKSVSPNDSQLLVATQNAIKHQYSVASSKETEQRATFSKSVPRLIQALEEGVEGISLPRDEIQASMVGAPAAYRVRMQEYLDEEEIARKGGQEIRNNRFEPTEKWRDTEREIDAGKGVQSTILKAHPKSGATGPGAVGADPDADPLFAPRVKAHLQRIYRTQAEARDTALFGKDRNGVGNDPAAYVADAPTVKAAFAKIDPNDPTTAEAYATSVKAMQEHIGVPEDMRHVLRREDALKMANQIAKSPDASVAMERMQKQMGDAWGDVFKDMVQMGGLPAAYESVHVLGTHEPQAAADLARALNDQKAGKDGKPAKDWSESIGTKQANDIKTVIEGDPSIAKFRTSLRDSGFSREQAGAVVQSVITLGYAKAYYHGLAPAEAAGQAIEAFTSHHDTFALPGSARVPLEAVPTVKANVRALFEGGPPSDLGDPPPPFGQLGQAPKSAYWDMVKANPHWVTSKKGNSAMLMDSYGGYVRRRDGKPIEIPYNAPMPPPLGRGPDYSGMPAL